MRTIFPCAESAVSSGQPRLLTEPAATATHRSAAKASGRWLQKKKACGGRPFSWLMSAGDVAPPASKGLNSERADLGAADAITEEEVDEGHFFGSHFCAVPRKSFR
ncbi:hypothetical protein [Sphingomonas trueperi]|uniref:hypothetical protein n=1 Tax=Sphingomonas trueperi TaxID=53317 RepID=UPI0011C41A0F